jgi:hypothetical protein
MMKIKSAETIIAVMLVGFLLWSLIARYWQKITLSGYLLTSYLWFLVGLVWFIKAYRKKE